MDGDYVQTGILEAANAISEARYDGDPAYRGAAFSRTKPQNRNRLEADWKSGRINVMMESNVIRIDAGTVELEQRGEERTPPNDSRVLPMGFLKDLGIAVNTHYGD